MSAIVVKFSASQLIFLWLKRVLDQGQEQSESKMTVLSPLIIIILIT
jgi:hypothetical protein